MKREKKYLLDEKQFIEYTENNIYIRRSYMKETKKQNLWFLAGLIVIGLILFWRCFYSVNRTDEAFYIGTTYRLWSGDGMLSDEWMPTQQLCSFWLIPFFALFRLILGSNEGMILAFRFLYIFWHFQ